MSHDILDHNAIRSDLPITFKIGCVVVCFAIPLYVTGWQMGYRASRNYERQAALKAGVAEWRVDSKTGDTKFHYKESK